MSRGQLALFEGLTDPPYPGRGRPPVVRWSVLARVRRGELGELNRRVRRHLARLVRDGFVVRILDGSTGKVGWRAYAG